jgi:hypothetical protein
VTLTEREPVDAPDEIVTFAESWVALANELEFTVIPVPENDTVAPETNPVPVTVTVWLAAPWPREEGLVEATVGAESVVRRIDVPAFPAQLPSFAAIVKVYVVAGASPDSTQVVAAIPAAPPQPALEVPPFRETT